MIPLGTGFSEIVLVLHRHSAQGGSCRGCAAPHKGAGQRGRGLPMPITMVLQYLVFGAVMAALQVHGVQSQTGSAPSSGEGNPWTTDHIQTCNTSGAGVQ
jgi:hypothetical protein